MGNIRASKTINKSSRYGRIEVEQHSLPQTIALHLLPGLLAVVVIAISGTIFKNMGLPFHLLALLFGGVFVLSTIQMGILVYLGEKQNGHLSLAGIVLYRQPMPVWQYLALALPLLFWVALIWLAIVPPIDTFLIDNFFSWMPDTFFMDSLQESYGEYSQSTLLVIGILWVLFVGIISPTIEELYFRGYLLPRQELTHRQYTWIVHGILFTLFHFFWKWNLIVLLPGSLFMAYAVQVRQNTWISVLWHGIMNFIPMFVILHSILG